jgi:predicted dehydrogenase
VSHRFPVGQADEAYRLVTGDEASLGILLEYPDESVLPDAVLRAGTLTLPNARPLPPASTEPGAPAEPVVGLIGSGAYATRVLLPALRRSGVVLHSIASSGGASSTRAARKFGARYSSTDAGAIVSNGDLNTVVIATRHDTHAELTCAGLRAGKHVFVEKPLAISEAQLESLSACHAETRRGAGGPLLMVGFNRRFAPHIVRMKALLAALPGPKSFVMTVNAGAVPASHWTQDPQVGGGRIVGEGCHFIDLLRHLAGVPVAGTQVASRAQHGGGDEDVTTFVLTFSDGSIGTVHYLANGHRSFPKERLEVFCSGRILQLDNFRVLRGFGWPGFRRMRLWRQDKGNAACVAAFVDAVRRGLAAPIPFEELAEVTRVSLQIAAAARG